MTDFKTLGVHVFENIAKYGGLEVHRLLQLLSKNYYIYSQTNDIQEKVCGYASGVFYNDTNQVLFYVRKVDAKALPFDHLQVAIDSTTGLIDANVVTYDDSSFRLWYMRECGIMCPYLEMENGVFLRTPYSQLLRHLLRDLQFIKFDNYVQHLTVLLMRCINKYNHEIERRLTAHGLGTIHWHSFKQMNMSKAKKYLVYIP
jgi:hypothetical protein